MPRKTVKARYRSWSYSAGSRGKNRVRAFRHPKNGGLYLEWRVQDSDSGVRVVRESLVGVSLDEAMQKADRKAVELLAPDERSPHAPLTIGSLFDIFLGEADPERTTRQHNERAARLFLECWGADRLASTLSPADVDRYVRLRRSGQIAVNGRQGRPVRDRVLEEDLTFLRTVIRWATRKRKDRSGNWLLSLDPLGDAVAIPREKDPHRPLMSDEEIEELLRKAEVSDPRLWLAMQLCHHTGRRLNSVRQLRWSEIDLSNETICWRGEYQKNGQSRQTPVPRSLLTVLRTTRQRQAVIGEGLLFPSRNPGVPLNPSVFHAGLRKLRKACGISGEKVGFHAFRRRLASDLASAPLAVVAEIGGWKHPDVALKVYQQPNLNQQRSVLEDRQRYRRGA